MRYGVGRLRLVYEYTYRTLKSWFSNATRRLIEANEIAISSA